MKSVFALLISLCALTPFSASAGFITIDSLTTLQRIKVVDGGSNTNTIATSGAVGGYRTLTLSATVEEFGDSSLSVSALSKHLSMSSEAGVTVDSFSFKWAGSDGNGFAPQNFLTLPSGMNSQLEFGLHSSDLAGQITWKFTDTGNRVSSYSVTLPVHPSSTPISYAFSLNSFTNPTGFDWTQIKAVELTGGGVPEWDFTLDGIVVIGVPEPGSAGLLLISLTLAAARFRRRIAA